MPVDNLNEKQKEAISLISNLELTIKDLKALASSPENFLNEYFNNVEEKIRNERQRLVVDINVIADRIDEKLKKTREDCFQKLKALHSLDCEIDFDLLKIANLDSKNKIISSNESQVNELTSEISKVLIENERKVFECKSKLLNGFGSYFNPSNFEFKQSDFGHLIIDDYKKVNPFKSTMFERSKILTSVQSVELKGLCGFKSDTCFSLIYQASEDGFEGKDFHRKCDGFAKTLTIIKVMENSNVFGGYTEAKWESPCLDVGVYKADKNAFIFSLINKMNKPIKLNVDSKKSDFSIFCHSEFGPAFGVTDFDIRTNSNVTAKGYSSLGRSYKHSLYSDNTSEADNLLAGKDNFLINEIEVYTIEE